MQSPVPTGLSMNQTKFDVLQNSIEFQYIKEFSWSDFYTEKGVSIRLLSFPKNSGNNTDNEYCCEDEQTERKEIRPRRKPNR